LDRRRCRTIEYLRRVATYLLLILTRVNREA
jgi:hypothetical protein